MKHNSKKFVTLALLITLASLTSEATIFFSDTFSNGSTANQPVAAPTANSTSYQSAIGLAGGSTNITSGHLGLIFPNTSSVLGEYFALFAPTNAPVSLAQIDDYIAMSVVFSGSNILAGLASSSATINIGLYNAGGVAPNQGNIVLNAGNITGGTEDWVGYFGRIFLSGNSSILTRPAQTPSGTTSQNQDLLFSNASGNQAFNNPAGVSLGSTAGGLTLTNGATYTLQLVITLTAANTLSISNAIFAGSGTSGTPLFSQTKSASSGNYLTASFNGMAVGWRNAASSSQLSSIDINSIEVSGQSTAISGPPSIDTQPVAVTVATNGSCAFFVSASGFSMTYQWHRNGTNLINGGNISGATSDQLVISSATDADVASVANGYYVTVSGAGGYSTNSTTNSLTLINSTNLIWNGSSGNNAWDLNTSINWLDTNGNASTFNYGDPVTFNDSASVRLVNLSGRYLSASSVIVDGTSFYNFLSSSSGGFAGPGGLIYKGSGQLTIGNANPYTGGTIISNSAAYLYLQNYAGLGTGPITLAKAGGQMEIVPVGSANSGLGDVVVADDFTITIDGTGSFAGVILGNVFGTTGKTLTFTQPDFSTTNRYRIYGAAMTNNANLAINGPAVSQAVYSGTVLAPYQANGIQVYNGAISGNGGLIQRGNGTTILTGQNTYAGGTYPTTGTIGFGSDTTGSVTSGPIGTGPLYVVPELPNTTGSGQVFAYGGARTVANPIKYPSGTNNQTLIIGGSNQLTFTGNIALQGLDSQGTYSNRIFQVTNTAPTIFAGVISDNGSAFGITKTGNGTLYLNAANTYTGMTTNSAGVLAGSGSIAGSVLVQTNASIGGGAAASIGTLTVNGNLTFAQGGGGFFRVNRSGSASDMVSVAGTLSSSSSGIITINNLGATLQSGDSFALFNKAVTGGSSLVVTGGLTAGLKWTNNLAVNGTIQVVQSVATNPTNIVASVSSGSLILSWPADHTGWTLQVQTNNLNTGLGTNWVAVPGSSSINSVTNPINPASGSVFYRLVYP